MSRPATSPLRLTLLLPLALGLVAAACGGDDGGSSTDAARGEAIAADTPLEIPEGVKLRIGDQGSQIESPLRLSGQLEDLPYEVEFASFASGPLVNEAIGAGQIDLGGMGDTPALLSFASGLDTRVVAVRASDGAGAVLVARPGSGIETIEDLEGKKLAYTTGTNTHGFVLRVLEDAGLAEDDIEQVDVPLLDLVNVLNAGDADAAVVYEFFLDAYLQDHPDAIQLVALDDYVPNYSFLLAPLPTVRDPGKLAALEDLVGRLARAAEWVKANEETWIEEFYVKQNKQTPEAARAAYAAQGTATWVEVGGQALQDQVDQARLFHEAGRLPEPVDIAEQFDPDISDRFSNAIKEAQK